MKMIGITIVLSIVAVLRSYTLTMATTIMTGVNLTATLGCGSYNNFVNMRTDRTNDYRLSDALQGRYASMDHRQLLQYYSRWQGSIVHEYLKLTNKTKLDTSILFDVVQKKRSPSDKSVAVLHVRLGDVVTNGTLLWKTATRYHGRYQYVFSESYYKHVIHKYNLTSSVRNITIVGSTLHSSGLDNFIQSFYYVELLTKYLESQGFQVSQRIDCGTPDQDFLLMASTQTFIQGGGGYSQIAASMVRMVGNQVIFDPNYKPRLQTKTK
jgi:hypothetical protein